MTEKELKTLKDFESKGETHGYRERWISETELKAEAVKELKIVDNPFRDYEMSEVLDLFSKCKTQKEIDNCLFGIRNYLIWKNNLTEEDLK